MDTDSAHSRNHHLPYPAASGSENNLSGNGSNDILLIDSFRSTPIPTFVLNANLHVTHVSDSYCAVSGVESREQLLESHIDDLSAKVAVPSSALVHGGLRAAQDNAGPSTLHESLNDRYWSLRTVPVYRDGAIRCFLMEIQVGLNLILVCGY